MTRHFLDITAHVCPMTFVRTRLLIDTMAPGDLAEIRLKGEEPLANVPRSVRELGHDVLSLDPVEAAEPGGETIHHLIIRKRGGGRADASEG